MPTSKHLLTSVQASQLLPPGSGHEYDVSFLKHEFFFEKLEETSPG